MSEAANGNARWTAADVPDQTGRIAVVTGASAGLGLEAARVLAARGATVILACRDLGQAERAVQAILASMSQASPGHASPGRRSTGRGGGGPGAASRGGAGQSDISRGGAGRGDASRGGAVRAGDGPGSLRVVRLDLASLASVREAATGIGSSYPQLDLLINNAGVMGEFTRHTEDGFEPNLGVNHLGHFALTGLLLSRLQGPGARIVTVSSLAHLRAAMRVDDLRSGQASGAAGASDAYAQSKLANLLFTYELDRRLRAAGSPAMALAAHPGVARTELWRFCSRWELALISSRVKVLTSRFVQDAELGALPALRAAIDPAAAPGAGRAPSGVTPGAGPPGAGRWRRHRRGLLR